MLPEGFLVLVKIKMVGEGGIFLFLMYPVLKLEICPVACKRKQIIFKEKKSKKQNQSTFGVVIHPLRKWSSAKWEQLIFQVLLETQLKRKEMEKCFWIQRFVHWISLKKVPMC